MSQPNVVFISGATGPHAAAINGAYDRTSETTKTNLWDDCCYPILRKRGDANMMMEHLKELWQVKAASDKSTDSHYADVAGGCALEACTSRQWRVTDGKILVNAPGLKMVTGAEAERKVSGCCTSTPP